MRGAFAGVLVLSLCCATGVASQPVATRGAVSEGDRSALPGVELAETIATATGLAITPLLGVSAVGAWRYFSAEPQARAQLPWYASWWFWAPAAALVLLMIFKDPVLGWVPAAKKPLDALDVVESKASAILATPVVIPMFLEAFTATRLHGETEPSDLFVVSRAGLVAWPGFLEELSGGIGLALGVLVFLASFFCIWLAFHAVNVLILLSPFGFLDVLLRSSKLMVLVILAGTTLIHPYLGLPVALLILLSAIPLAGWAFRLMVFGSVVATDLALRRHRRAQPATENLRAFTVRRLDRAKTRTYGSVSVGEGAPVFSYRPRLVSRPRAVQLPQGQYRLGRGLMCPILQLQQPDGKTVSILRFPPRFRTHEQSLVELLSLDRVEDLAMRKSFKILVAWLGDMVGLGADVAVRVVAAARQTR